MKDKKAELARKRAMFQPTIDTSNEPEGMEAVNLKPTGVSFKSRMHSELRQRDKDQKERNKIEMIEKKSRVERLRSYSKNVKEMYAPKHSGRNGMVDN